MNTLEARINVQSNRVNGPTKPRFSKLTAIRILAVIKSTDGKADRYVPVAERTIPGVWTTAAALAEFMRFPKTFMFHEGYNADTFRNAA